MSSALHRDASRTATVVATYARFSSDLQREASIADQNRRCAAEIQRLGWKAGRVFSDRALSGASAFRSDYQALLDEVRRGAFHVLMAEALDRLSRDPEDLAGLFKRCQFAGIRIYTLAEGWVSELHVGLKGTMSALFLKDLADKTRRGLRGRVEAGASAGGLSYGYDVVLVPEGEDRGGRTINAVQAAVVVRIFTDYGLRGLSPKRIAAALNHERVPSPSGGNWSQSTINGNRKRGTGILNNALYAGFLVWNRLSYVKDPDTGKRRSRFNAEDDLVVTEVPHLRVVDQSRWDGVKARQAALDAAAKPAADGSVFHSMQRPKHLFAGLLRCGCCGGGFSTISATHLGCSTARNKGEAACSNRRTAKRDLIEATVLEALRTRLMAPAVYAAFVRGFTMEWNKDQGARDAEQAGKRDEMGRLSRKIGNLVEAIAENGSSAALQGALASAEARKAAVEAELAAADAPAPFVRVFTAEWNKERARSTLSERASATRWTS